MTDYNEISFQRAKGTATRTLAKEFNTSKSSILRHTKIDPRMQEIIKNQQEAYIRSTMPDGFRPAQFRQTRKSPELRAARKAHWQKLKDEGIKLAVIARVYEVSRQLVFKTVK